MVKKPLKKPGKPRSNAANPGSEFEAIFRNSPVPMSITTMENGEFVEVNKAFLKVSGYRYEEVIGKRITQLGVLKGDVSAGVREHIALKGVLKDFESQFTTKSGEARTGIFSINKIEFAGKSCLLVSLTDVTGHREATKAAEMAAYLLGHSAEVALWTDMKGQIFYANEAALRMYGYTIVEFLKKKVTDIEGKILGESLEKVRTEIKERKQVVFETVHRKKNGVEFPVEVKGGLVEFGGNQYFCGFVRDITERKRVEASLRSSEERFRSMAEQLHDVLFVTDTSGRIAYISPSTTRFFGWPPREMTGRRFTDFLRKDQIEKAMQAYGKSLATGEASANLILIMLRKDGSEFFGELNSSPVVRDGKIIAREGVIRDVTDRIEFEGKLIHATTEWRKTFDAVPDLIAILDARHRITRVNHAMAKRLGKTPAELVGCKCYEAVHGTSVPPEFCPHAKLMASGKEERAEALEQHLGGWFNISTTPIRDGSGKITGSVHVARDITEAKKAEEALRRSEEKFSRAFKATPAGIAITRLSDGAILQINDETRRILGYKAGSETGRTTVGMNIWADSEERERIVGTLLKDGVVRDQAVKFRSKTGSLVNVRYSSAMFELDGIPHAISSFVDVTKQMEAEEALKRGELKFRFITENVDDAVWQLDPELHITYVSPSIKNLTGYSPEEMNGRYLFDFITPESANKIMEGVAHMLELQRRGVRQRQLTFDAQFVAKDGRLMDTEIKSNRYFDDKGNLVSYQGIARDITEKKRAGERLRRSEVLLDTTINAFNEWIHVIDEDLRVVLINDSLSRISRSLGYNGDIIGARVTDLFSFLSGVIEDQYREVFRTGKTLVTEERQLFENGIIYVEVTKTPVFEGNRVTRVITMMKDITGRKAAESSMRLMQFSVDRMKDAVFMSGPDGVFTYVNDATSEMLGYSRDELIGHSSSELDPEFPMESLMLMHEIVRRDGSLTTDIRMRRKDGSYFPAEMTVTHFEHEGVRHFMGFVRDITERKSFEDSLRKSEERFRNLVEIMPFGVFIHDGKKIIYANPSGIKSARFNSLEDITGHSLEALAHPDDRMKMANRLRTALEKGAPTPLEELKVMRKDGETAFLEVLSMPALYEGRTALFSFFTDITEQKKAKEDLTSSEERFRNLVESAPFGVFIHSDGKIIYSNPAGIRFARFSNPADIIGFPLFDLAHPDSRQTAASNIARLTKEGGMTSMPDLKIIRRDGEIGHMSSNSIVSTYLGEKVVFSFFSDITENKKAGEQLKNSEQKYHQMVEMSPSAVILHSEDIIRFVNRAAMKLLGATSEDQLVGRPVNDIIHPDYHRVVMERRKKTLSTGETAPVIEEKFIRIDGKTVDVEAAGAMLMLEGKPAIQAVATDISERKAMEHDLRLYQSQLQQLATRLAATEVFERKKMAAELHDNIGQALALARMRLGLVAISAQDKHIREGIEEIGTAIEKTIEYTRDLTVELYPPVLRQLGLDAAVESLGTSLQRHHGISFKLKRSGDIRGLETETKAFLYKSARELMHNVVKHAAAANMNVAIRHSGKTVSLKVTDDGKGFDKAMLKSQPGAGRFGLFSVTELVSALKGTVSVESSPGNGTSVTIKVPVAEKQEA